MPAKTKVNWTVVKRSVLGSNRIKFASKEDIDLHYITLDRSQSVATKEKWEYLCKKY